MSAAAGTTADGGGGAMQPLESEAALDAAMRQPSCVLFKHSTTCPISRAAHAQMRTLLARRPDAAVFIVDVRAQRGLSDAISDRLGARHESPQAFVLHDGAVAWSASHFEITADAVATKLAAGGRAPTTQG